MQRSRFPLVGALVVAFLASFPACALGVVCEESSYKERFDGDPMFHSACTPGYSHPDTHKEGILRYIAVRDAFAEGVMRTESGTDILSLRNQSRLPRAECVQFLQDFLDLRSIEVLTEGASEWATIDRGSSLSRLDPKFREWRLPEGKEVEGYVVVRWRNSHEFLIRAARRCGSTRVDECTHLSFTFFDAHDNASPIACSTLWVALPYWRNWMDEATPIWLEIPGAGPRQRRAVGELPPKPPRRPLKDPKDCPFGICLRDYR